MKSSLYQYLFRRKFYFACSLIFFLGGILKKRKYDIIFYTPSHFNRGANGSNLQFEPFYNTCRSNGLTFIVFEEPNKLFFDKGRAVNGNSVPFDLIFYLILIIRKIIPSKIFSSTERREWFIANIIRIIFLRNLDFKHCIVLSNSLCGFFRGLKREVKLYDYQHGIISRNNTGYLFKGCVTDHIRENDVNILVHGQGFRDILINNDSSNYYTRNVHIIGKETLEELPEASKRNILISLQFTMHNPNFDSCHLDMYRGIISKLVKNIKEDSLLLLKHHPRYEEHLSLDDLSVSKNVQFYSGSIKSAMKTTFLHITCNSSLTFDASFYGIPTLLIKNSYLSPEDYHLDFDYPIELLNPEEVAPFASSLIEDEKLYIEKSYLVKNWSKKFYSPFDQKQFLNLVQ